MSRAAHQQRILTPLGLEYKLLRVWWHERISPQWWLLALELLIRNTSSDYVANYAVPLYTRLEIDHLSRPPVLGALPQRFNILHLPPNGSAQGRLYFRLAEEEIHKAQGKAALIIQDDPAIMGGRFEKVKMPLHFAPPHETETLKFPFKE